MNSEQINSEQIIGVFKRFDKTGRGQIPGSKLIRVLQVLVARSSIELDVRGLISAFGIAACDMVSYAEFVSWIICADELTKQSSNACQAALDGDVDTLRMILASYGTEAFQQSHFVHARGAMAGLISWGGAHAIHLQGLSEGPPLPEPATPLQYAALAGKTQASKFLLNNCGLRKDDEGTFGRSSTYIANCHRLGIDDHMIADEPDFEHVFEEEEHISLSLCTPKNRGSLL
mmetsp:Transcript_12441/g.20394  ORF Transcript_12441/g.20394 Transcript_12441/m.20394 type:complete len:231 (-) Transcript_12441:52-744(-)